MWIDCGRAGPATHQDLVNLLFSPLGRTEREDWGMEAKEAMSRNGRPHPARHPPPAVTGGCPLQLRLCVRATLDVAVAIASG